MTEVKERPGAPAPAKRAYVRAVGPRLRIVLYIVFALVALLGANSVYLAGITALGYVNGRTYEDLFYLNMILLHVVLGLLLVGPFVLFGIVHLLIARKRRNRRAVRIGYALFAVSLVVLASGVLLMRFGGFDLRQPVARSTVYWMHVLAPLAAVWLYCLHRLAGPRIKWRVGLGFAAAVAGVVIVMMIVRSQDPREWYHVGSKEGVKYFEPSLARTTDGNFIPARALMNDEYCKKCHADIFKGWFHSAHRFSSFNNPAYLASVRETREVSLKRDGSVKASRWCAGCHDPVPFFSGAFDDPEFDVVNSRSSQAGVTCTVCHAITNVNSNKGNADYTIEEPLHYPFAYSENPVLQYLNNQLVKAKPSFHKQTFLKPFHRTAEFCSTCHKVHLPKELNHYKDFLRGQNHYDPYLLSGVSGHGARSFYYPPEAKTNCAQCHMPLKPSADFGAKRFEGAEELSIHNHLFPTANTGVAWFNGSDETIQAHQEFLKDTMRVDIFAMREGGEVDGRLIAPIRPEVPALKPGDTYLLETVIRTMKLGHLFTQGTVDSNEVWMDVKVVAGATFDDAGEIASGRVIGRSGGMDEKREVDRWSHFVNVFVLDREGNRINRRNPQDIFVPLYNNQIPPGAGQVVHYGLYVPADITEPVTVEVKLQYRKFDQEYMEFVTGAAKPGDRPIRGHTPGEPYVNELPVTTMAVDRVTFPLAGRDQEVANPPREIPEWQRWNDYGIGLLLEGKSAGGSELRQAAEAFTQVEKLGQYHGPLNLARVYIQEGSLDKAVDALARTASYDDPPAPPWTVAWLTGEVNRQQGHLDEAIINFRSVLEDSTQEMKDRKFDFSLDYVIINRLGTTLFERAKKEYGDDRREERERLLRQAVERFEKTLTIDSENLTAHYNLAQLYALLGDEKRAAEHDALHERYKPDENAQDEAIRLAREKYPAADHAAEAVVIYPLHRRGAPELPPDAVREAVSQSRP